MMIITWPLIGVCLLLVFTIGGGGFYLGYTRGCDKGERDRAAWCDVHHQGAAPELDELDELDPCPLADYGSCPIQRYDPADPRRLPGRHAVEPDTWPLDPIFAIYHAEQAAGIAWALREINGHPQDDAELDGGVPSPAAVELDVAQMIERNELEVQHLIRRAEQTIGEITDGR